MSIAKLGLIGYVIFLAVYSVYKYNADVPSEFSLAYVQSVAILVAMTGIAPFLFAHFALKAIGVRGIAGSVFWAVSWAYCLRRRLYRFLVVLHRASGRCTRSL